MSTISYATNFRPYGVAGSKAEEKTSEEAKKVDAPVAKETESKVEESKSNGRAWKAIKVVGLSVAGIAAAGTLAGGLVLLVVSLAAVLAPGIGVTIGGAVAGGVATAMAFIATHPIPFFVGTSIAIGSSLVSAAGLIIVSRFSCKSKKEAEEVTEETGAENPVNKTGSEDSVNKTGTEDKNSAEKSKEPTPAGETSKPEGAKKEEPSAE